MIFDVTIPSKNNPRYGSTYQVDARNWMLALQTGLQQEGTALHPMENFHVELGHRRIVVTDPASRRVFIVRKGSDIQNRAAEVLRGASGAHPAAERGAAAAAPAVDTEAPTGIREPVRPQAGKLAPSTGNIVFKDRSTGSFRAIGAAPSGPQPVPSSEAAATDHEPTGRILAESRTSSGMFSQDDIRAVADGQKAQAVAVASSALEDVFLDIMTIFEPGYPLEDAIDFVLDLGKNHIPCDHGALFFANDDASCLYSATAFGEKKDAFLDFEISITEGLPALAMREGFTVNVQDPESDNRHTPEIEQKISFKATSVICAPVQFEGRSFGAISLFNRKGGSFAPEEANILAYIGQQMGKFIQLQLEATPL